METQKNWMLGEARIVLPKRVAYEATVFALPLQASLALLRRVLPVSEAKIASLLALSGASFLTSRLRSLAHCALVLVSQLRTFLVPSAVSGSDAESATLLTHRSALSLASRDRRGWTLQRVELASRDEAIWALSALVLPLAASLALSNSADDVSGATVASLVVQNDLVLASHDRRCLALWRAEIVSQSETILALQEAESIISSLPWDFRFYNPHSLSRGCFKFTRNFYSFAHSVNMLARGYVSLY